MRHYAVFDRRVPRILAVTLLAAACTDGGSPTEPSEELGPQSTVVVDFEAGNGEQFAFLQPLTHGRRHGPLARGLSPIVIVCDAGSNVPGRLQRWRVWRFFRSLRDHIGPPPSDEACVELEAEERGRAYHALWRDRSARFFDVYTITVVTSFGLPLGELTLTMDGRSGDVPWRRFPIRFWIGEGIGDAVEGAHECIGDDRCNADAVPDDEGTVVVTTQNENGATMAQLTFPQQSVPDGGFAVILDCREGGFAPGEGPLPTALDQWPLFCNITAFNPDGSPFTGELPSPAELDICIVDQTLQPAYHDFPDHDDLVVGKSDGPGDFILLEKKESIFGEDDCELNTTTLPEVGFGEGILRELDTRLAPVFGVFMPEELRATPMWFRDGGVGGLITSFSDVNPVEPAYISGTVSHATGGIQGVTVTLSGAASDAVSTDAGGSYQFGPLQAAVDGGSSYTVTVSGLPEGESIADPDVDVLVAGTGTTVVDFETELPDGVFFYEGTGNYYQAFSTPKTWEDADLAAQSLPTFRTCSPRLASVLSAGEDAFIVSNMPEAAQAGLPGSGGSGGYWLGGLQPDGSVEPEAGWTWQFDGPIPGDNSSESGYANWAGGEPNNLGGGVGEGATNVESRLHYIGDWTADPAEKVRWNDEPASRAYGYVIEYSCPTIE